LLVRALVNHLIALEDQSVIRSLANSLPNYSDMIGDLSETLVGAIAGSEDQVAILSLLRFIIDHIHMIPSDSLFHLQRISSIQSPEIANAVCMLLKRELIDPMIRNLALAELYIHNFDVATENIIDVSVMHYENLGEGLQEGILRLPERHDIGLTRTLGAILIKRYQQLPDPLRSLLEDVLESPELAIRSALRESVLYDKGLSRETSDHLLDIIGIPPPDYRRSRIITLEAFSSAILAATSHDITREESKTLAVHVLNFFGFADRITDNALEPEERDYFYMLEDLGLLATGREETTLYDGTEWRIHYWNLRKERILTLAQQGEHASRASTHHPEDERVYDEIPDVLWKQRND